MLFQVDAMDMQGVVSIARISMTPAAAGALSAFAKRCSSGIFGGSARCPKTVIDST